MSLDHHLKHGHGWLSDCSAIMLIRHSQPASPPFLRDRLLTLVLLDRLLILLLLIRLTLGLLFRISVKAILPRILLLQQIEGALAQEKT